MSVDLEALRIFVRVAELSSFTRAAEQLGMPKARASAHVQRLEAQLGTQLLKRSTRVVRTTPEGEQLLARARGFLAEADELGTLFQAGRALKGRVRVDLPVFLAREHIIPRLPELLARHPQLHIELSATDRLSAASREGIDLVLRLGPVNDEALVGRKLGVLPMMNYASTAYLRQYGTPHTLEDLRDHLLVHYATDKVPTFEYLRGDTYEERPMRSVITVDDGDAYGAACRAGLGIVQVPRMGLDRHPHTLVEVLPELTARPLPVTLLHTHGRSVPRRVRAVMTWLGDLVESLLKELVR